ncbi:MAG: YqgE/AlgH family protein [Deltaproteobacteria bacterium]|nr:YqgE/AlgH family protein [Deltaproteobacteria bacterium]
MPQLADPNFSGSVVLICEHDANGALGLVINRPTPFLLGQIFQGQGIEGEGGSDAPIHQGGPVQPEMGFVLYENGRSYEASMEVLSELRLGTSLEILRDIAAGTGPVRFLFFLGYAGWSPDQLEQEIARNDWLTVPATAELLFDVPAEERWDKAIRILGIDPSLLSQDFGTA